MEFMLILRVLLRRWWLVVIPVAIVAGFAVPELIAPPPQASGGFRTTVRYTAAQALEAIPNRDGDFQDVWLASELAVNAFTEWIRSGTFTAEVRALLPAEWSGTLDQGAFASDNARSIGVISIGWHDAEQLALIARAVETVLETRTADYFPQLGGEAAQVRVLDSPQITPAPAPIASRLAPLLKLMVALVGGVALAFGVEYLDPYVYRREQVEARGVPVLSVIPRD